MVLQVSDHALLFSVTQAESSTDSRLHHNRFQVESIPFVRQGVGSSTIGREPYEHLLNNL